MKTKLILIPLLTILFFLSCESQPDIDMTSFDTAPLYGMIYDADNLPVPNAEIKIDNFSVVKSDNNGRFIINGLSRGSHIIEVTKKNFKLHKPFHNPFTYDFLNREQLLYLKMISIEQLLAQAEKKINEKNWPEAMSDLDTAAKIDEENKILLYLRATVHFQKREYQNAVSYLNKLVELGATESAIFLTVADIYEYKLGNPVFAHAALHEYLQTNSDDSIMNRKNNLLKFVPDDQQELSYSQILAEMKVENPAPEEESESTSDDGTSEDPETSEGENFED